MELTVLKPLGDQAHAAAIPEHKLDPVGTFCPEHVDCAGEWVATYLSLDQRSQALRALR